MLNITNKTPRAALVTEIESMRIDHQRALNLADSNNEALGTALDASRLEAAHYKRKAELLATDRDNLLGTIRVMADSSREVRIRKSSVRDADMAYALPAHNAEKLG